ncbi:MAG TPA: toll/interleukin-1 receptor domain-containing protein [Phycisphaerae bacterium]|nr:toll/interleukin-1 receptor domain-containing protein [Phycisphaerae bacterium]
MPRRRKPRELFLSHATADKAFVNKVAALLRDHDVRVWYSRHHLRGADRWHDQIGEALQRCDWFLVVLSPASTQSMWVKREVLFALKQHRFSDRILPVLYKKCDPERLSWALDDSQMVDFTAGFDRGSAHLLNVWRLPPSTKKP